MDEIITPIIEQTPSPELSPTLELTPTPEISPTLELTPTPEITLTPVPNEDPSIIFEKFSDDIIQQIQETGSEIVEMLQNLSQNDVVMYECIILITGILVVFAVVILCWLIYKFIRLFI